MAGDSEDLVRAIVEWSHGRPLWEQQALGMLARGDAIGGEEVGALTDVAEREAAGERPGVAPFEPIDLLGRPDGSEPVGLLGIRDPKSVNALTWGEGVSFAPSGITVVYGQNGSGKSGYARILKKVTRARHDTEVLTNVFEEPSKQSARLTVSHGSDEVSLTWPSERPDFLSRVSFYDRDCGTQYISADTEVVYRPGALALLDDLVRIAGRVRAALEERSSAQSRERSDLPQLPRGSQAAGFLTSLTARTTSLNLDIATEVPSDADDRLAGLRQRIASLDTDDSDKKRVQLGQVIEDVEALTSRIAQAREILSDVKVAALMEGKAASITAREAADAASTAQFASEPLGGVGGSAWRLLWDAARRFSDEVAYPDHRFPLVESEGETARCVLCQQTLSGHAASRLRAFDEFVAADSERAAREAQSAYEQLVAPIRGHEVLDTAAQLSLQRIEAVSEETPHRIALRARTTSSPPLTSRGGP